VPEAERAAYVEELRRAYREDIDIVRLASDLHIDGIVSGDDLRGELVRRYATLTEKIDSGYPRKRPVLPV
jgi:acetyl-CoA carboxylase carboxyltransferase component